MNPVVSPFPLYVDTDGSPLDAGYIFYGLPNENPETSPTTVYWDSAGNIPAAQPIRTLNGYPVRSGTPAQVFAPPGYSLSVKNRRGVLVLYAAQSGASSSDLAAADSLAVNGNFAINQRMYVSGTPTTGANQLTIDRWRVVVAGQSISFGAAAPDRVVTAPAGGMEQSIQADGPVANVVGGVYTLSWEGTATATVNGNAITNGGNTALLAANTAITIRFSSGTVGKVRFNAGSVALPFENRGDLELFYCQADYQKSYASGTAPGVNTTVGAFFAAGNVAASISANIRLGRPMRVAPVVSLWDTNGNFNSVLSYDSAGTAQTRAAGASAQTTQGFNINSGALGTDVLITGHWAAATGL